MTWANQIRILKQQFEALGAVIGQNCVYAIKPIVQALNVVMAKLIQFANVVSASLGKIFGWKFEDTTGGIVNDLEFGADAAEDLGGGLGGAADKAKKLRQQLQGFDELNVLTTNQGSSGGGGGGGGFDNEITSTNAGQWVRDTEESLFESDLDSLYKLGDYIGTTLTNQLKSIDWNSVYEGARNFGTGLADFLNGLISPELFSATGSTIAGALNTAIYSTLAFGEKFDFEELGLSIAESINSFFRDTDFKALGEDIKTWVNGLKATLITIIKEVEWGNILSGIGEVLGALDAETIITLFGFKALSMLFKRNLFSTLAGALSGVVALPASLTTGLAGIASLIYKGFIAALTAAFVGFKLGEWIYEQSTGDDTSDINYFDYLFGENKATKEEWLDAAKQYLKDSITIEEGSLADAIIMSFQGKSGKEISSKRNGEPSKKIQQLSKDISKYFGSSSKVVDLFAKDYSKDMKSVSSTTETLKNNITSKYNNIKENAENSFNFVKNHILGTTDETTKGMANSYNVAAQSIKISSSDTTSDIVAKYKAMRDNVASTTTSMKDSVNANSNSIKITSADTTSDIVAKYKAMRESNVTEVNTLKSRAVSALAGINTEGGKETDSLVKKMISQFQSAKDGSDKSFTEMQKSVVSNMNKSKNHITGQNWYGLGGNLVVGLRNGLVAKWSSTSGDGLVGKIVSLARGLTYALQKAFGIASPSKIWRDDIGYWLSAGLEQGVLDEEDSLAKSFIGMGNRLTNDLSDSLTLATPSNLLGSGYNMGVTSTIAHSYSADSSMSSSVADGVRQGLSTSQAEQNALLREQNDLLYQILQKESISSDDVYNVVVNKNRDTFNRTGTNPLFA